MEEQEKVKFDGIDSVISIEDEPSEKSDQFVIEILKTK